LELLKGAVMNRQTLILGLVVVVGCLVLGFLSNQPLAGQAPAAPAGKVGKYQVVVASDPDGKIVAILCDTETGQVWQSRAASRLHPRPLEIETPWRSVRSAVKK
jgi:hypothetical protein